jgi:chromosome segregation ATPase
MTEEEALALSSIRAIFGKPASSIQTWELEQVVRSQLYPANSRAAEIIRTVLALRVRGEDAASVEKESRQEEYQLRDCQRAREQTNTYRRGKASPQQTAFWLKNIGLKNVRAELEAADMELCEVRERAAEAEQQITKSRESTKRALAYSEPGAPDSQLLSAGLRSKERKLEALEEERMRLHKREAELVERRSRLEDKIREFSG